MPWVNYHSHTKYCDGTDEAAVYAETAQQLGMLAYGFSTHSPVPFENAWSIKDHDVAQYLQDVNALKEKYVGQLDIYLSMEVDYVPNMTGVYDYFISNLGLDYTVGSVHFVDAFPDGRPWEIDGATTLFEKGLSDIFGNNIQAAVKRYFDISREMLATACPTIVGHIDKIKMHNTVKPFFDEQEDWYRNEVMATLEVLANTNAIMEVNTRGIYKKYTLEPYPSPWIINAAYEMGIPVVINSDAHHPREILGEFEKAATIVSAAGYKTLRVLLNGQWQDRPFNQQGIII
ncbi:MAG: histidinol-phosphatase [Chitinophagales bacterium]|nr:histidinol-phosphatase [Chitinophagales bacterium]